MVEQRIEHTYLLCCVENRRCWLIPVMLWSLLVGWSLQSSFLGIKKTNIAIATESARKMFNMIELSRLWNARHGGVYVPISDKAQPNPFLDVPNREIFTIEDKKYTLINPAYMTRQIAELAKVEDLTFHITSLLPIRPANSPDSWEEGALRSFEQGDKERAELVEMPGGHELFRYMAPLKVKPACMKCHEKQGYIAGDIRGGISVSMPAATIFGREPEQRQQTIIRHLLLYLLFLALILLFLSLLRRQILELQNIKQVHQEHVDDRSEELQQVTAKLETAFQQEHQEAELLRKSEERYRHLVEALREDYFFYTCDAKGRAVYFSPSVHNVLGYSIDEMLSNHEAIWASNPDIEQANRLRNKSLQGIRQPVYEVQFAHSDGSMRTLELNEQPLWDSSGQVSSVEGIAHDITALKQSQAHIRQVEARLEAQLKLALLQVDSEKELIDYALEECVRLTDSKGGYLHFFDNDERSIQLYTWSKEVLKICTADQDKHYPLDMAGVWADCIRQAKPVIHNDYPGLEGKRGLPEGHFPLQRHMSVPIYDGEKVVGIAGVGNKEEHYSVDDSDTVSEFMIIMWQLLKSKRTDVK